MHLNPPWYSMTPSVENLFKKTCTCEAVLPIISVGVRCFRAETAFAL
jgi:hypothetical protein